MSDMYIKPVPPTFGGNVIMSKETWADLVRYMNSIRTAANAQADEIVRLQTLLDKTVSDVKTIASAVGGIYNAET